MSRYIVGIDLGTTNSCVFACDTHSERKDFYPFAIPQVSSKGMVENGYSLPSALFLIPQNEREEYQWRLPWDQKKRTFCVGSHALTLGEKQPNRLVHSAKSWLCHDRVHRKDNILPVDADPKVDKVSPLKATYRILEHIKEAWNAKYPSDPLEEQEVQVTLPASFDEVARQLTMEAAMETGIKNVSFLEEPQAAFYAYLAKHEKEWEKIFQAGDCILVVDVGGGTSDFSLISVVKDQDQLRLERTAVGSHLLLGGDNLDLSLQYLIIKKLNQKYPDFKLSSAKKLQIKMEARRAKEHLLESETSYRILIEGEGSSLIGGSLTLELSKDEVEPFLLDGFFGSYSYEEALKHIEGTAIQSSGLPFVKEPSIVKQLAAFLDKSKQVSDGQKPNYVLFNGGTMKPQVFQEAIVHNLNQWLQGSVSVLKSPSLDQSVARGACYFGWVKRGKGVSIKGGCPKAYYLLLNDNQEAMTLIPRGVEAPYSYKVEKNFQSKSNTPLKFSIYCSHIRKGDQAGEIVKIDEEEMAPLPPMFTMLEMGKNLDDAKDLTVELNVTYSEIGAMELHLRDLKSSKQWKLDFQMGASSKRSQSQSVEKAYALDDIEKPKALIENAFQSRDNKALIGLMSALESCLGMEKEKWPPSLLRALWDEAFRMSKRRQASPEYAKRWWQLMGFLLRPGLGYPLDEHRIKKLWKLLLEDFSAKLSKEVELARLISIRRIASGFSKGQQLHLAKILLPDWTSKKGEAKLQKLTKSPYLFKEMLRLFSSLESLDTQHKERIGNFVLDLLEKGEKLSDLAWSLGRIGSRNLVHASLSDVVSTDVVHLWLKRALQSGIQLKDKEFIFTQLAAQSGEASTDFSTEDIKNILNSCVNEGERARLEECMQSLDIRTYQEVEKLIGDQLPLGLTLLPC